LLSIRGIKVKGIECHIPYDDYHKEDDMVAGTLDKPLEWLRKKIFLDKTGADKRNDSQGDVQ
jgi:hypothetical protein